MPRRKSKVSKKSPKKPITGSSGAGPSREEEATSSSPVPDVTVYGISVHRYDSEYHLFAPTWSHRPGDYRIAVVRQNVPGLNNVCLLKHDPELDQIVERGASAINYKVTNMQWIPDKAGQCRDLIATTSDYLSVMSVHKNETGVTTETRVHHNTSPDEIFPYTSLDWSETDPAVLVTSCWDGTVVLWNIETQAPLTTTPPMLQRRFGKRHANMYDVSFSSMGGGKTVFAASASDGAVRLYDTRDNRRMSVLLQSRVDIALIRVECNKANSNYVAANSRNSHDIIILDVRKPNKVYQRISDGARAVYGIGWSPNSTQKICSIADTGCYKWDVTEPSQPCSFYSTPYRIISMKCSKANPELTVVTYDQFLEVIKI